MLKISTIGNKWKVIDVNSEPNRPSLGLSNLFGEPWAIDV